MKVSASCRFLAINGLAELAYQLGGCRKSSFSKTGYGLSQLSTDIKFSENKFPMAEGFGGGQASIAGTDNHFDQLIPGFIKC